MIICHTDTYHTEPGSVCRGRRVGRTYESRRGYTHGVYRTFIGHPEDLFVLRITTVRKLLTAVDVSQYTDGWHCVLLRGLNLVARQQIDADWVGWSRDYCLLFLLLLVLLRLLASPLSSLPFLWWDFSANLPGRRGSNRKIFWTLICICIIFK